MTDPVITIDSDRVAVEPGGQASVGVKITNPGTIVEGYRIEVVGEGVSAWAEVLPPEVSVYPQQDATAVVVFSPPGGTGAPGGSWPFGVRVRSTEDDDASAVAEGELEIGKVFGLQAKLVPVNSSGRWSGRHMIQVSNWGNSPAKITLTASNPDEALGFMIRPEVVELPLGGTANARIWVRTKKPFLRGTPVRLPFTVVGEQEGAAPAPGPVLPYGGTPDRPTVDGALNQKPIISKGAVMLGVLALLAAGGLVAYAITRPPPAEATFQELGPPEQPKGVKVEPIGAESVRVGWEPVPNVEGYTLVQVLADGSQTNTMTVAATDSAKEVPGLTAATKVCFKVQAVRGKLPGPFSDQACGQTGAAQPSQTASPSGAASSAPPSAPPSGPSASSGGGQPSGNGGGQVPPPPITNPPGSPGGGPSSGGTGGGTGGGGGAGGADAAANPAFKGKWFGAAIWPVQGTVIDPAQKLAGLRAKQPQSGLASSSLYPRVTVPIRQVSWILYAGPFENPDDASASCAAVREVYPDCRALQLDP